MEARTTKRTPRGKAISSRNATKHGLWSEKPPVLAGEDKDEFDRLMQGLIAHYQPQNPVEGFLLQQIAVNMWKQARLWRLETAASDAAILKAQMPIRFPDQVVPPEVVLENSYEPKRIPRSEALMRERTIIERLMEDLRYDLEQEPQLKPRDLLDEFRKSLLNNGYDEHPRTSPLWASVDAFDEWLCQHYDQWSKRYSAEPEEAIDRVRHLLELAQARLAEIDASIAEIEKVQKEIQQSEALAKGLQSENAELFNRSQRAITKALYEAIDRLEAIREQR